MRIALVAPGGFDRSGRKAVIPALLSLTERLARRYEVTVVALHQEPDPCRYPLLGAEVINLGQAPNTWPDLLSFSRLRHMMSELDATGRRPDVLHGVLALGVRRHGGAGGAFVADAFSGQFGRRRTGVGPRGGLWRRQ